ncbi:unnamed protein product [Prunus armeniaca]|uniref:Uncharacterized protein n=1 Tax=Prunus armeniaca TaxID=36596 RepID=A0A6J5WI57_PRUAR|nr:unnamed protein product [Prunus armeniaca]
MVFKREHGREGEWIACEMQASSPMNSWRMFQLGVSWVHQRFKGGYISWGMTVSFGKYFEWVYKGLGLGVFSYVFTHCHLGLVGCLFIPSIGLYAVTGETGVSPTKAMAAGVSAQLMRQHAKFHDFKLK